MRIISRLAGIAAALALLAPAAATASPVVLLTVDDGSLLYDTNNDCVGDTDSNVSAVALRHWHVGLPFAPASAEVAGGFGCLGGPKTWTVTVSGASASVAGTIKYAWDKNVPGGGFNDVHLSAAGPDGQVLHTATEGVAPIVPGVDAFLVRTIDLTLTTGTWTLSEDVFFGEHTAWLTTLTVTDCGC